MRAHNVRNLVLNIKPRLKKSRIFLKEELSKEKNNIRTEKYGNLAG